jgi:hypothetical protein
MSIAEESLRMSGLFEAELLTELMMRHWNHPLANELEYRTALLETAAEILRLAISSLLYGARRSTLSIVFMKQIRRSPSNGRPGPMRFVERYRRVFAIQTFLSKFRVNKYKCD